MCIINGCTALSHLHVPPPFERREHHEQVGCAVALVFVIDPRRLPFLHRHRHPRFLGELLGGFIQTNQGTIRIVRPCVHGQHVLHGGYEGAICFGRDDPLRFEVRFELSFLKPDRSCCRWRARQCRVPQPCSPASARSNVSVPSAAWSRPMQSVWLPSRRQKSAARTVWMASCGSEPPQGPLPPVADASGRPSSRWSPALPRSDCRSIPRRLQSRRLSRGSAPSSNVAPSFSPSGSAHRADRAPPRSVAPHISLPQLLLRT